MDLIHTIRHLLGGAEERRPDDQGRCIDLLMDTAALPAGARERAAVPPDPQYATYLEVCLRVWSELAVHTRKETLLPALAAAVAAYPHEALPRMMANFENKTADMQKRYRDRLLVAVHREIFDTHHRLMTMSRDPPRLWRVPRVREGFSGYCTMAAAACRAQAAHKDPALLSLTYLLAGFAMYIEDGPGHPVETPFPGGLEVSVDGWTSYCPVREHADDVPFSICPFCPAVQSEGVHLIRDPEEKKKVEQKEYITNYFTNFKG
ncbi:hypothetical protein AZH53_08405 [Methanomicrobiaceae archaeon CYW5]|uniref:DUF2115 family protein n=1 Tax=Methanovulcanius yangii TaxID=1789227 RepID=UPI0029CA7C24|nr:DUF2115 family protein [Methanovulcanius yangii]MBT8508424.1 hypothetical protein [Methanovulcanius yangii]